MGSNREIKMKYMLKLHEMVEASSAENEQTEFYAAAVEVVVGLAAISKVSKDKYMSLMDSEYDTAIHTLKLKKEGSIHCRCDECTKSRHPGY